MNKIKLFEAFAGYGGWSLGLKETGIDYEIVGYSEVDKYAVQCYEQNHKIIYEETLIDCGQYKHIKEEFEISKNYGDIKLINPEELPDFDLFCASPPCQSFSIAGKGLGNKDVRGDLFEYAINIMKVKQPKYAIFENVKGLISKKHKPYFDYIIKLMEEAGYTVTWKVLNTKDYGVPQNRERVFIVCFNTSNATMFSKEVFDFVNFSFPEKEELKIFLKDILEDDVDEKYYLKEDVVNKLLPHQDISYCLDANYYRGKNIKGFIEKKRRQLIQVNNPKHSNDRVYNSNGVSPTLNTMQGGNRQPFITENTRVRKLTPKECFRLQGFLNDQINLEGLSKSQQYKLAGNGLSINVISKLMKKVLK